MSTQAKAHERLFEALRDTWSVERRVRDALSEARDLAQDFGPTTLVAVQAQDLEQLLHMVPRGINGMVDLPWTAEPPLHMLPILARARHMWPGELDCIVCGVETEWDRAAITLVFTLGAFRWSRVISCCCPDEHVSETIKEAIQQLAAHK